MNEAIQIKCPFDGAVLTVKNQPGIETKNVTCPVCKNKYPFTQFKRVLPQSPGSNGGNSDNEEHTQYGGERTCYGGAARTVIDSQPNYVVGKVKVVDTGAAYQLKVGRNVIGRKGQKSGADFQIDTGDNRSMSREHIVIEVKKVPEKGYVHYVSLFKEKVNATYIEDEALLFGDCIVLNHGDLIKMPDVTLLFEIPDEEATEFQN